MNGQAAESLNGLHRVERLKMDKMLWKYFTHKIKVFVRVLVINAFSKSTVCFPLHDHLLIPGVMRILNEPSSFYIFILTTNVAKYKLAAGIDR